MYKYLDLNQLYKRRENNLHRIKNISFESFQSDLTFFSMRQYVKSIYDQGQLGSCTANAFCAAFKIQNEIFNSILTFEPSRLFTYYVSRVIEGTADTDSGILHEYNVLKSAQNTGVCTETLWPYDITKYAIQPTEECYIEASKNTISNYYVIPIDNNLINSIKATLQNQKIVLFGLSIYESWEYESTMSTGDIPIPDVNTETNLGGHELCIIGYDDNYQSFLILNSYGDSWGDNGFGKIPYDYITNPYLGIEFTYFDTSQNQVPCFNKGTKILCLNNNFEDEYIPIENLTINHVVKTYLHGYRKIKHIANKNIINDSQDFTKCMYTLKKNNYNNLLDDLTLTGGHSILVNNIDNYIDQIFNIWDEIQMIDDKFLLLVSISKDFIIHENNKTYTIYHFCLENDGDDNQRYGIWANGILTESTSTNYMKLFNLI